MDFPYTKGIVRPNAQYLSFSLSPLVAQRSLLFRVQTDLRNQADYGQLSSDVSSTLWTASAMPSNVAMSTGTQPKSSAISTSSIYSQDSWRSPPPPVNTDVRRYAMALSPSVEWEERKSDEDSLTLTTPIQSSHPIDLAGTTTTTSPSNSNIPMPEDSEDSLAREYSKWKEAKEREGNRKKLKKVHPSTPKRASRSSKAFSKVLARLSIQPLGKRAAKRQTMPALSPIFQLPEVQMSPIHIPIPASPSSSPTSEEIGLRLSPYIPPVRSSMSLVADVQPHPPPPYRRIHKRYPSSPAILGWNPKMLPTAPVSELPTHILGLTAPRPRSHIAKRTSIPVPPVPPLPAHVLEQDHNPIDRLRQLRSEVASAPLKKAQSQKRATLHNPFLSTSAVSRTASRPAPPNGPLPTRLRSRSFSQKHSDRTLRDTHE